MDKLIHPENDILFKTTNTLSSKENTQRNRVKKWKEELNRYFCKDTDGQKTHEKTLNISNHQGNANQNPSVI